ncbi:hypothetical protein LXA43DRAFT_187542 [Ganoderma leucocontextum]|nr:hypothetical protein LXA43DRAFT_187542 [Ganoderma leucocontextum]
MSRRAVPFLVAGVTGVLSGIYIFKPLFDQSNQRHVSFALFLSPVQNLTCVMGCYDVRAQDAIRDMPAGIAPPTDTRRSTSSTQGNTNPEASKSSGAASTEATTENSQK